MERDFLGLIGKEVENSETERDFLGIKGKESESPKMERDFLGMKGKESRSSEVERDFLGMKAKESGSSRREEGRVSRQDSVFGENQSMQPPSFNKLSALQQFMSYNTRQEERARKLAFDQLASPGFHPVTTNDPFEATRKSSMVQAQPKTFTSDRQGVQQFPMHTYQSHSNTSSHIPMHLLNEAKSPSMAVHDSISVATNDPFFTAHSSPIIPNASTSNFKQPPMGSNVGAFTLRDLSKPPPTTAQLTIFYNGSVCVYNDVPADQAQAIMSLANKGYKESSNASTPRPGTKVRRLSEVKDPDGLSITQTRIESVTQNRSSTLTNQTQDLVPSGMPKSVSATLTNQTQDLVPSGMPKGISATLTNQTQTPKLVPSPHPGIKLVPSPHRGTPNSVSPTSHTISHTESGSSATTDLVRAKINVTLSTNIKNDPPNTTTVGTAPVSVLSGGIPHTQARKASLARFLEKRKERVISVAPYPCSKDNLKDSVGINCPPSKSSTNDIPPLSNCEELLNFGSQSKNPVNSGGPSTTLHI